MTHPVVLGREYACLSAACGPDQSTSNKEDMEMRAERNKEQQTFLFVRFPTVLRRYLFTDLRPELFQRGSWRKNLVRKAAPLRSSPQIAVRPQGGPRSAAWTFDPPPLRRLPRTRQGCSM